MNSILWETHLRGKEVFMRFCKNLVCFHFKTGHHFLLFNLENNSCSQFWEGRIPVRGKLFTFLSPTHRYSFCVCAIMRSGIALIGDGQSLWYTSMTQTGELSNIQPRGEKVDVEVEKEVIWMGGMCTIVHCQLPHFLLNLPKWSFETKDDARKQLLGFRSLRMGEWL